MKNNVFFKLSSELHVLLNQEAIVLDISSTFLKALKFKEANLLIGSSFLEYLVLEDRPHFFHIIQNSEEQKVIPLRLRMLSKRGQNINIKGKLYKENLEEIYFTGIIQLAQDSPLARFKRFFDLDLLDLMIVTDGKGKMILSNKGFLETFGARERLKNITLLRLVDKTDKHFLVAFTKGIKKEEGILKKIIVRMIDKKNQLRWLFWRLIFIKGSLYAVAHDITELKEQKAEIQKLLSQSMQQNKALQSSRETLEKALKTLKMRNFELDQFVYRTSHDLRAPLTSILGLVNLARIDKDDSKRLMEYIAKIKESTLKLDDFIKSLLDYSKSGRAAIATIPINFEQVFTACKQELEYLDHFKDLEISLELKGNEIFYSDALRIQTIFTNVFSNAIKYQKKYGDEVNFLKVEINLENPQEVMLNFTDNGIGIDKELIGNIFDMFFRATEASVGSGLGLYIVKQTIDKLEGKIFVESKRGEGTTFKVILPNLKDKSLNSKKLISI